MYDVIIIGAGVVGSNIAYNLGKYNLNVLVIEKEPDVAMHASKANSAIIHSGYDATTNSLKAKLNVIGTKLYPLLAQELNFPYHTIGSMVLAFDQDERKQLDVLYQQGLNNGVTDIKIIDHDEIIKLEPNINDNVIAALYAPNTAIICPYETTLAFASNAALNNVKFIFDHQVKKISFDPDYFVVDDQFETRYIINAAGAYSDDIAKLIQDDRYTITARKGEYLLLDRSEKLFNHVLFQTPTIMGKGVLITPTVDGNTLVGPTAFDQQDKEDDSVTANGIKAIKDTVLKTTTKIDMRKVITTFAGIRAVYQDDFVIEPSYRHNHFINLIGIASPGLASAPAIGEYVIELLQKEGLILINKDNYISSRTKPIRITELNTQEYQELISKQPLYGKIVCRCELVSEQEIIDAINQPLPALTLDGIKRRTRAGMGRCQSSFCSVRILELLSEYQNTDMTTINKSYRDSFVVVSKTKGVNHE